MNEEMLDEEAGAGAIYALVASPTRSSDNICFAATERGLLRSIDGGGSFEDAYAALELPEALPTPAVAVSPAFASDRTVFAGVNGAILRSLDGGTTWQYAQLRTPPPIVTCLAVSPAYEEDGIAFAGTLEDGVFRTADRGSRWASWNFGLIDLSVLCLAISPAFGQDETLLAGTETGLFRSSNGGRAWREVGLPADIAPVLSAVFSPRYTQDGCLFAGTESNGLWMSVDRGISWMPVETLGSGAINGLLIAEGESELVLVALVDEDVRLSEDGGRSWRTVLVDRPVDAAPMSLAAPDGLARGRGLLVGCSDGLVRQAAL